MGHADADAVISAVRAFTGTALRPVLVGLTDVCLSPEARVTLQGKRFVSAVALVGASVVDRVIAAALLRNQACPRGYFTSVESATKWLSTVAAP